MIAFYGWASLNKNELRRSSKFERSLTKAGSFSILENIYILRKWASLDRASRVPEQSIFQYRAQTRGS
jgi:hypothetical protein